MTQKVHKYLVLFLLVFFSASFLLAEGGNKKGSNNALKAAGGPTSTLFNVNNVSTWIYNNGDSDIDDHGNSGFEFPKGSGKTAVFETGFIWGGKVDGQIRFGGSTYNQGIQGGAILPDGTAEEPTESRIFRVRNDWATADLSNDIAKLGYSEAELRAQYEADWNQWPAAKGAPYEDVDGNGSYDPATDIPGVPGADQTVWYVANDLDPALTTNLYGALPFGVEIQSTFWGYNTQDALGNMMFRKYMIINKSDVDFTDMYVSIWSDVDLGGASDDFSGVDIDLSLAYTYNGTASDEQYGLFPPAVGFDFFQGPMIPGEPTDTAIFNFEKRAGFTNMPATAHYFFINGDNTYSDPPLGDYQGSIEFYNLVRGRVGTTGQIFAGPPPNDDTTTFALSGDPLTQTGWLDGQLHVPGDRRQGMASGPFNMAVGDTQDIVVAEIAAGAFSPVDRLGAIGLLKFYDQSAQIAYDNLFQVPKAPTKPITQFSELENEVIISWYQDEERVVETENYSALGFNFEGYCVYQLPYRGATSDEAKLVATYDIVNGIGKVQDLRFDPVDGVVTSKVVKFGTDSGINRFISITGDAFNSGAPLLNGSEYFFAVTSYAVHEDVGNIPRVLENPIEAFTIIPQSAGNGVRLESAAGDDVPVAHQGNSDGTVIVSVIDPADVTGIPYTVTFEVETDTNSVNYHETVWNMKDPSGNSIFSKMALHTPGSDEHVLYQGLKIQVAGPPAGINPFRYGVAYGEGSATSETYLTGWDFSGGRWLSGSTPWGAGIGFFGGLWNQYEFWGTGVTDPTGFFDVDLRFAGLGEDFPEGAVTAEELRDLSMEKDPDNWSKAALFVRDGNYPYPHNGTGDIPISAWNAETGERLNVAFLENALLDDDGNPLGTVNKLWDLAWTAEGGHKPVDETREFIIVTNTPYDEGAVYSDDNNPFDNEDGLYMVLAGQRGSNVYLEAPWEMNIFASNVIVPGEDVFTITTPGVVYSEENAKMDIEKINVFPNPYYGVNPQELNKYNRWVTFSHLPEKAEITIVNLGGQIVRKMNKESESQFLKWDLANENGLPVASGLYLVYVDLPDLGETKILKVAIFQEQQVLDRF